MLVTKKYYGLILLNNTNRITEVNGVSVGRPRFEVVYLEGKFNISFPYTEVKREKHIHIPLRSQQGRVRGIEHEPTVNQVDTTGCERRLVSGLYFLINFACDIH